MTGAGVDEVRLVEPQAVAQIEPVVFAQAVDQPGTQAQVVAAALEAGGQDVAADRDAVQLPAPPRDEVALLVEIGDVVLDLEIDGAVAPLLALEPQVVPQPAAGPRPVQELLVLHLVVGPGIEEVDRGVLEAE